MRLSIHAVDEALERRVRLFTVSDEGGGVWDGRRARIQSLPELLRHVKVTSWARE